VKFILVVERKHLFPGLSPQGFLPLGAIDLDAVERWGFFAEREYMENCSHYKQIIPYISLILDDRVLAYQRRTKHSEARLGGLWTIGFGGHVEPFDRGDAGVHGLLRTAALRELEEETGLRVPDEALVARGCINSEKEDVSSVHAGLFHTVDLASTGMDHDAIAARVTEQVEPWKVEWVERSSLAGVATPPAPQGGEWEDWTKIAIDGLAAT
jgi:predicted NUDIX family phosphoesterase